MTTDSQFHRTSPVARFLAALLTAVAVLATLLVGTPSTAGAETATFARNYSVYVPPTVEAEPPLVVFLHGCSQSGAAMATATRLNELADQRGFVAAYIDQKNTFPLTYPAADGNGLACWNWFHPDHQKRDQGEPKIIADITRHVVATYGVDPNRVYIMGMSAGANMTVIMAANYPDVYAAAGVLAGCSYAACTDQTGALTYEAMGPHARVVPMFVIHGTADTVVPYPEGVALVHSWLNVDDRADNGSFDGSVSHDPSAWEHHGFDQPVDPLTGDPCLRSPNWPCLGGVVGFEDEYPHTVMHYDVAGCNALDFWTIYGMEHAWPNSPGGPFTDPLGPNVTTAAFDFFHQHKLGRPCNAR